MSGYHNVILPETFSQGSGFMTSFDSRVITLESGVEERLARYNPWGRRKYSVLRGIANSVDINDLRDFFILRQGALNSFKMKDWTDYATNATRTTHRGDLDDPITPVDESMVLITGRTYQAVTRYTDGVRTVVRPIQKINTSTFVAATDGIPTGDYTLDSESGQVTFGGAGSITTASCGFEFYTVVRFAESTDKAFQINMQSTLTASELPGIDLIEEIEPLLISQDYQYGGAKLFDEMLADTFLSEVNGRLQSFDPKDAVRKAHLPLLDGIPEGGPLYVIHCLATASFALELADNAGAVLATLSPGDTRQVFKGKITPTTPSWIISQ